MLMKKHLSLLLIVGLFTIITGCAQQTATTTNDALAGADAAAYSAVGVNMAQTINGLLGSSAQTGSIGSLSVKSASIRPSTTTDEGGGSYHLVETTSNSSADLHLRLITDEASGQVTTVEVYGSYTVSLSGISYTQSYGSAANPYKGIVTWSGSTAESISFSGITSFSLSVTSTSGTTSTLAMTFTYSNFSIPITSGTDYPTGTVTVATTVDGIAQTDITLTFNGTATASMSYGTYTGSINITETT
ncbi:MAG: hypothetical protein ABIH50_03505 [bacterium]